MGEALLVPLVHGDAVPVLLVAEMRDWYVDSSALVVVMVLIQGVLAMKKDLASSAGCLLLFELEGS